VLLWCCRRPEFAFAHVALHIDDRADHDDQVSRPARYSSAVEQSAPRRELGAGRSAITARGSRLRTVGLRDCSGVREAASAVAGGRGVASGRPSCRRCAMGALLIGYARCSTDQQDLTAQRDGLAVLGVDMSRVYVDHGLTSTNRERPGLREALAACREGDTWSSPSSTGWPGPCPTRGQSRTS
jgi:hypothetical protein